MFLSIVIPAYNEEKIIENTLDKIKIALRENESNDFQWEIIVCDNHSTDRTAEIAAQCGASVVTEAMNHISRARNSGAAAAQGDWLLFIDADSYPHPGTVADLIALIKQGDAIGCSSTIRVDDAPYWYKLNVEGHNIDMRLFKTCMGLFIACQAEAFHAIDGFSTDLYALEDIDFCSRLKAYGKAQNKTFKVLHKHPVITSGRKGYLYGRWDMTKSGIRALWHLVTKRKLSDPDDLPFWYDGRR